MQISSKISYNFSIGIFLSGTFLNYKNNRAVVWNSADHFARSYDKVQSLGNRPLIFKNRIEIPKSNLSGFADVIGYVKTDWIIFTSCNDGQMTTTGDNPLTPTERPYKECTTQIADIIFTKGGKYPVLNQRFDQIRQVISMMK